MKNLFNIKNSLIATSLVFAVSTISATLWDDAKAKLSEYFSGTNTSALVQDLQKKGNDLLEKLKSAVSPEQKEKLLQQLDMWKEKVKNMIAGTESNLTEQQKLGDTSAKTMEEEKKGESKLQQFLNMVNEQLGIGAQAQ